MRSKAALVRIVTIVMAAGTLAGCRDVGLPGNIPREEAENRQFRYSVYQATAGSGATSNTISFDDRSWLASAELVRVPERLMQPVGTAGGGVELFAPAWSSAPHARLYARAADGRWHPLAPVIVGDGHGRAPVASPGHG